ncbi:MAG: hypothetical protein A3H93_16745 [Rhodocyclales bacterium RIFCSPLOWO2_02_FULL_63_24]|nr:MAG: hypothetical protein A2040_15510 [Rhodocyclales bacterium GWA2_65_19]OHC72742.1 MAG: hypothetical protein A3H93_16745 [Rhodocyclales bacterium RIFCSPLOWO2_02_FULL_63_24]
MLCRLLVVDDDQHVLNALRRELLRPPHIGTEGIEIETFRLPTEALQRAAEADGYFDAAIVDYHMPDMDGIVFLDRLRDLQPDAVRLLLTGSIDADGAIAAINAARVDHLIAKPWHEYDLKSRIALALHQRQLRRDLQRPPALAGAGDDAGQLQRPYRLLLVDDEPSLLKALVRELSLGGRVTGGAHPLFEIIDTTSAATALELARNRCPDLVIADYAMLQMDGIELLHQLRQVCPRCVRILMSGHANPEILMNAINIAGVYHFIGKPWEASALRAVIAEALTYRSLLDRL